MTSSQMSRLGMTLLGLSGEMATIRISAGICAVTYFV
jgi:hypothetical protein